MEGVSTEGGPRDGQDQSIQEAMRTRRSSTESRLDPTQLPEKTGQHESEEQVLHYKNNLLWTVGLLELSNAMDFPANVWNDIPPQFFAKILMGIGGSIAILWSIFACIDLCRSLKNIACLRRERRFLNSWRAEFNNDGLETQCLVQALLDVNFRELGWELIDRVLLDVSAGTSGVLVGTGALMAIRGDLGAVYLASNLLSGYVGNSILAPYALINAIWAVFMWKRAGDERKLIVKGELLDPEVQMRTIAHARRHKLYAFINGITAIAGTVGSIVSSTLWYGYVVIAPCVFTALFCNLLWRNRLGYTRRIVLSKETLCDLDIEELLSANLIASVAIHAEKPHRPSMPKLKQIQKALTYLHRDADASAFADEHVEVQDVSAESVYAQLRQLDPRQRRRIDHQERHLIELYSQYSRNLDLHSLDTMTGD